MSKDIEFIKVKLTENKEEHREIIDALKGLDNRFASKLTERLVYGLVGLVMVAFVTKLINLW